MTLASLLDHASDGIDRRVRRIAVGLIPVEPASHGENGKVAIRRLAPPERPERLGAQGGDEVIQRPPRFASRERHLT